MTAGGADILRMQAGETSSSEMLRIATLLLDPSDTGWVHAVASLSEQEQEDREASCEALVIYAMSKLPPLYAVAAHPPSLGLAWCTTSIRFVRNCAPQSMVRWKENMVLGRSGKKTIESVRVSPYLAAVLRCAEDMWRVPGHLVTRG